MLNITNQMPDTIYEGERVIRILTGNVMDELYTVTDLDGDELEEEVRKALRLKHGKGYRYEGFEDVTYVLETAERARDDAAAAWEGDGWYEIGWSDGGTYGEPRWYDTQDELNGDLECAYFESTETHLPYAEFLWDGEMPPFTKEVWEQGLGAYLDSMSEVEYARLGDDGRAAVEELAKAWGTDEFEATLDNVSGRIWR